jgi:iron complex outermembrane recepter protein
MPSRPAAAGTAGPRCITRAACAAASTLAATVVATNIAVAQAPVPEVQLPPVVVEGQAALPSPTAATVPDNAAREAELRELPGNVTLVPSTQFRDRPAVTTLQQALEYTPGVFAATKWGEDSRLSIRGSGVARNFHLRGVRLYWDGIPTNQADGSGDFQELDPLTAYRIEVLRGANAFTLGANTLGGAINFVSPTGRLAPGAPVRGEAGSWEFARGQLAYGVATEQADGYVTGTALTQQGYRDHSAGRSYRLNANAAVRWGPGEQAETRVFVAGVDVWQQIPGTVTRSQALTDPKAAAPINVANNYLRNIRSLRIGTVTAVRPVEGVRIEVGGSYVDRELDHPIFQVIDQTSGDVNLFVRATLEGSFLGLPSWTVMGGNFPQGSTRSRRYLNNAGSRGALVYAAKEQARTSDAYIQSNLEVLPRLQLVVGVQLGEAWRSVIDELNPAPPRNQSGSGNWQWVNPRFGFLWQVLDQAQIFGNLSWSTEPPTLSDLTPQIPRGGFQNLDAQRAMTLELGTRGREGPIEWEVAVYRAWIKDEIQLFSLGAGTSFALNADRTLHTGVEAGMSWTILRNALAEGDSVALRNAYTFSAFRFDDDPVFGDNQLPGVPRHLLAAELRYTHPSGAWIAPTVNWVPQAFYVDNANTLKTDAYALVGLRGGWNLMEGRLSAFFEARNLANTRYIASANVIPVASPNSPLFEPGFGRAVFAGLQYRF